MMTGDAPVAREPFHVPGTGLVVSRHADVRSVLGDPRFAVPPPVPGGPAGTLGWLRAAVPRFQDGAGHARRRAVTEAELREIGARQLGEEASRRVAGAIERAGREPFDVMAHLAYHVPVGVLCSALGIAGDELDDAIGNVTTVAAAYPSGAATEEQRARADGAVGRLARLLGGTTDVAANRIGLLAQACDATAGLIGNALNLTLRLPLPESGRWPVASLLAETLRYDPPVVATRRRATVPVRLGGHQLEPGTTVLLHLAAANRDPAVFPDPHRFDPGRHQPAYLTFGSGRRPCPGSGHALALAGAVVEAVLTRCALASPEVSYAPPTALRVPVRLEVAQR